LSKEKCKFVLSEVTWFGFVFNEKGMKPDLKKVINQKDIYTSNNQTSCLALQRHTYSDVTAPLRKMLRKNARFEWIKECIDAFGKLKKALVSNNGMAHWCQGRKTELVVDRGLKDLLLRCTTLYKKNQTLGFGDP